MLTQFRTLQYCTSGMAGRDDLGRLQLAHGTNVQTLTEQ